MAKSSKSLEKSGWNMVNPQFFWCLEEDEAFRRPRFSGLGDLGDLRRGASRGSRRSLRDLDLDLSWSSNWIQWYTVIYQIFVRYLWYWYIVTIVIDEMIEGSLEVKLPTIWTDEKQRWEESERREEQKKIREEKESEERTDARKGRKVAKHCIFFDVLWLQRVEK